MNLSDNTLDINPDAQERFVQCITSYQSTIYSYIATLVPDRDQAEDVMQNTNLVIWRKRAEFKPGSDFVSWACSIAYYEVLAHRRSMARDRLVLDEAAVQQLAERLTAHLDDLDERRTALRQCLNKLTDRQRDLLAQRYQPQGSVKAIARRTGQTTAVISQTIYRLRIALQNCIRRQLGKSS